MIVPAIALAVIRLSENREISGVVTDGERGIAGATVHRIGMSTPRAVTDKQGDFKIRTSRKLEPSLSATKPGFFIGKCSLDVPNPKIVLEHLPADDCEDYAWVPSTSLAARDGGCSECHQAIHDEWAASGHARSANGNHFLELFKSSTRNKTWSLLDEYPDGAGVCTACHAPTISFGDPAYFDLRQARGVAATGVHCDYCHKIKGANIQQVGLTHGRFALELLRPKQGQLFLGPLDDASRGNDAYSQIYRESSYCAPCHEGTVFGVQVYSTYSEWLASPAPTEGKSCQSCHMQPTGKFTNIAPGHGGIRRDPASLGNHRFFSGSQADMLRQSLGFQIEVHPNDNKWKISVAVEARGVGHRIPTGLPDRHLILVVEGFTGDGARLAADKGSAVLSNLAGDELAGLSGVIFAKQLRGLDGSTPVPFWRARPEFVDSRLEPGKSQMSDFLFSGELRTLRVRLSYRRFWEDVRKQKGWPDDSVTVIEQKMSVTANGKVIINR